MKIVVLGATGTTGQLVIEEALSKNHEVIAFVRRANVINAQKGLTIYQGSIEDQTGLYNCFTGADAVISCLGQRPSLRAFIKGTDLQQRTLPKVISAINEAKVNRFVLMSSFGSGDSAEKSSLFIKTFLYSLIAKKMFDDKAIAEKSLSKCNANWTAVYPVTLKKGPANPSSDLVLLDTVRKVPGIPRLPFANVAKSLVELVSDKNRSAQKLLLTTKGGWL